MTKPDYGLDAPGVVRNLILAGIAAVALGIILGLALGRTQPNLAAVLFVLFFFGGLCPLVTSGWMVWSSRRGKLLQRERLLEGLSLRGDETVLDVGCGRGLLLIGAAKRLTTGKAIGLDLWRIEDLSGNDSAATLINAEREGVTDRVDIKTGDMRDMPFSDNEFDAIMASLSIHNIASKEGRVEAIREIARVLKSGGQVALLDFEKTDEYESTLRALGWQEIEQSPKSFLMCPPVRIVRGRKPISSVL